MKHFLWLRFIDMTHNYELQLDRLLVPFILCVKAVNDASHRPFYKKMNHFWQKTGAQKGGGID